MKAQRVIIWIGTAVMLALGFVVSGVMLTSGAMGLLGIKRMPWIEIGDVNDPLLFGSIAFFGAVLLCVLFYTVIVGLKESIQK